ncbi:MAG: DsbA family oxidoreductase [Zhengella sp.]|uniref:DsbA family oxidoreductase n=1 Tax=Zhengella sp. TaxID=2282762 RepID=UPI003529C83A
MRVDIVSDVVCPWCAVGYYQLAEAARQTGMTLDVHWHPFQLNPHVGSGGENLRDHLAEKYGTTPSQSRAAREKITALGAEVGFTFDFTDDTRTWNTFDAHRLIGWAELSGRQHETKLALLKANFTDNRNVSDREVLVEVAQSVGLDGAECRTMLDSGAFTGELQAAMAFWRSRGISGVPSIIFLGRHLVTGAQGVDTYRDILGQLAQMESGSA